jgi:hypothetical protein
MVSRFAAPCPTRTHIRLRILTSVRSLQVVRAVLYLRPDHASPAQLAAEFERYLAKEPPLAASGKSEDHSAFVGLQTRIAKIGGVQLLVSIFESVDVQHDGDELIRTALELAVTLFEGGNLTAQGILAESLSQPSSQNFFVQVHHVLHNSIISMRAQKRKIKQFELELAAREAAGIPTEGIKLPVFGASLVCMTEVIKTMRRMCMGQHKALQDIIRVQKLNKVSYNFLEEVVAVLMALEPELLHAIEDHDSEVVEAGIRGFLMLADAMRGPNHENQASIAHTGLIDLGDRIFGKIHFEDLNGKTKARNRHRNRHGEDRRKENAIWRNRVRSRLKSAVASCLLTFLEGVESDDIPNMMLTTVQWTLIGAQMACCHRDLARAAEVLDYPMLFEEGMTYYFILRTLYP